MGLKEELAGADVKKRKQRHTNRERKLEKFPVNGCKLTPGKRSLRTAQRERRKITQEIRPIQISPTGFGWENPEIEVLKRPGDCLRLLKKGRPFCLKGAGRDVRRDKRTERREGTQSWRGTCRNSAAKK